MTEQVIVFVFREYLDDLRVRTVIRKGDIVKMRKNFYRVIREPRDFLRELTATTRARDDALTKFKCGYDIQVMKIESEDLRLRVRRRRDYVMLQAGTVQVLKG